MRLPAAAAADDDDDDMPMGDLLLFLSVTLLDSLFVDDETVLLAYM